MKEFDVELEDFNENIDIIDFEEIKDKVSLWGNSFGCISKEQIIELLYGKVLFFNDGEYSHFVILKEE